MAQQIMDRLNALEAENQNLRDQMAAMQAAPPAAAPAQPPMPHVDARQRLATLPVDGGSLVDLKHLGKPQNGIKDAKAWPGWYSTVTAYLGAVDARFPALLQTAERSTTAVDNVDLDPEEQRLSMQLFFILRMLCTEGERLTNRSL